MTTTILPGTATVATFGGNAHRDESPPINPDTDYSAAYMDLLITQAAMASYTQERARVRCTVAAGVVTLADHWAVWGDSAGVAPVVVRTGTGVFTVTWATSYNDLQATPESHSVSIRGVVGPAAYNGASFIAITASATAANVVTVRTFDEAGVATDPTEFCVGWR